MKYNVKLNLPSLWKTSVEHFKDDSGADITHIEASLESPEEDVELGMIDVYVGDMPEDTTAEDQAFSNYADMVGFSEDDPEDFQPLEKIKFNGRNAWKFEALCEDESPMMCICQELRSGVLAVMSIAAVDEDKLKETVALLEHGLRLCAPQN